MNYYELPQPEALQQGDIYFAPLVRIESSDALEHPWSQIDQIEVELPFPSEDEEDQILPLIKAGYSPVMVLSHDCQMDRQMNSEFKRLRKETPGLSKETALSTLESDPNLDRFVTVAPILSLANFRTGLSQVKSGEVIGMFYVAPTLMSEIDTDSVVDLNYISTVDRSLLRHRVASLSSENVGRLRIALARLYALRSPEIGFELEEAVGQRIIGLRRDDSSPTEIFIQLKDGTELELLLKPALVRADRPSARAPK